MTIAEKLIHLRANASLSQLDLANALKVSRQSVSKWEKGECVPSLDKALELCSLFKITIDELVTVIVERLVGNAGFIQNTHGLKKFSVHTQTL